MNKDFEEFKQWWSTAKHTLKCDDYDAFEIWQASKASVTDVNTPEGWVVVPRIPTDVMINTYREKSIAPISTLSVYGYKAMIEAVEKE